MSLSAWLGCLANQSAERDPSFFIDGVESHRVSGHPNYAVSFEGKVFTLLDGEWVEHPSSQGTDGYVYTTLDKSRKSVHRLVVEQFSGPSEAGQVCRHLDGCKTNNRANNLKWGSHRENALDRTQHQKMRERGLLPPLEEKTGEKSAVVALRVSPDRIPYYDMAAEKACLSRHAWMRTLLDVASGYSALPEQISRGIEAAKKVKDGKW